MPKKEPAKDRQNSPRIQKVIAWLHAGRTPVDPVQAAWDADDRDGAIQSYYNFKLARFEWGRGKIPAECLDDYLPQGDDDGTG